MGMNMLGRLLIDLRKETLSVNDCLEILPGSTIECPAGQSRLSVGTLFSIQSLSAAADASALAFPEFVDLGIPELMSASTLSEDMVDSTNLPDTRRARALDRKYGRYSWFEDARSAIPGWIEKWIGTVTRLCGASVFDIEIVAVGAGAGGEARMLWSHFGSRVTLVDLGFALAKNCREGAPAARTLRLSADSLTGIDSNSADAYFALRTYDSAGFEIRKSMAEAARVLRPGGMAMFSVSNAYLAQDGRLILGQIGAKQEIDRIAPLRIFGRIADAGRELGFVNSKVVDYGSEIALCMFRT
jgi:SAM-dependent methyltransferase